MQRIGRFAGDRDQSWPIRVPVLPVAAARSSELPAGALDAPDRLLDLDGHGWTVGTSADGSDAGVTASATSRLAPSRHLTDRRRPRSPSHGQAIALPTRETSARRSSSSSARHCPSLLTPAPFRACPPAASPGSSPAAASPPAFTVTPGPASPDFASKSRKGSSASAGDPFLDCPGVKRNASLRGAVAW